MNTDASNRSNSIAQSKATKRPTVKGAAKSRRARGGKPVVAAKAPAAAKSARKEKQPSRQSQLIDLLRHPDGVTINQLTERFGWLPHSARAALTGVRKAGNTITKATAQDGTTTYRIV